MFCCSSDGPFGGSTRTSRFFKVLICTRYVICMKKSDYRCGLTDLIRVWLPPTLASDVRHRSQVLKTDEDPGSVYQCFCHRHEPSDALDLLTEQTGE